MWFTMYVIYSSKWKPWLKKKKKTTLPGPRSWREKWLPLNTFLVTVCQPHPGSRDWRCPAITDYHENTKTGVITLLPFYSPFERKQVSDQRRSSHDTPTLRRGTENYDGGGELPEIWGKFRLFQSQIFWISRPVQFYSWHRKYPVIEPRKRVGLSPPCATILSGSTGQDSWNEIRRGGSMV